MTFSPFLFEIFPPAPPAVSEATILRETGNNSLKRREEEKTLFSNHPPSNPSFADTKNSLQQRLNHKKAAFQRAQAAGFLAATRACLAGSPLGPNSHRKAWGLESCQEGSRLFCLCGMLDLSGVNYISWVLTELAAWAYAPGMKNNFLQRKAVVFRSCLIPQAPVGLLGQLP